MNGKIVCLPRKPTLTNHDQARKTRYEVRLKLESGSPSKCIRRIKIAQSYLSGQFYTSLPFAEWLIGRKGKSCVIQDKVNHVSENQF